MDFCCRQKIHLPIGVFTAPYLVFPSTIKCYEGYRDALLLSYNLNGKNRCGKIGYHTMWPMRSHMT